MTDVVDVAIIGGGIVGLATSHALLARRPDLRITVLEKEDHLGAHQTGRNSGVVHSGIYYKPGSLKARLCVEGNRRMVEFAEARGLAHERCGKLIVATDHSEITRLESLRERAAANGIEATVLGPDGITDHEPAVRGVAALWIPTTGIIDYTAVLHALADELPEAGGSLMTSTMVTSVERRADVHVLHTTGGELLARRIVNCAGLHSDRIAVGSGVALDARIVPFRGEYFELAPDRRDLIKGLVYPVPDPNFPFLGVHFTRMIDGSVHAGPNAVLAFAREGYRKRDISPRDLRDVLSYRGFWRLARRNMVTGSAEMARSFSKRLFLRSLRRLVPSLELSDIVASEAGVRAQLLERDGSLCDDFMMIDGDHAVHVCNAPSPAATSSLGIGAIVADRLLSQEG